MKRIVVGIVAHVDAGKTTCIESMLFKAGAIRKQGRVDHKDTLLDFDVEERQHGITIYSKEARLKWKDTEIQIIDTPGHVDFSSEMERALSAMDLAVIMINGQDGVQSHTETIWKCLEHYNVPAILFLNKMDISNISYHTLMDDLEKHCSDLCVDWKSEDKMEKIAMANDRLLEEYSSSNTLTKESIHNAIWNREVFPVLSGSVLKNEGTEELLDFIDDLAQEKTYPEEFGAIVYKISTDEKGKRLTHVRLTGGSISPKEKLSEEEKIDQIRSYSGKDYELLSKAVAGEICVFTGLEKIQAGMGLGFEEDKEKPLLNSYLTYHLLASQNSDYLALHEALKKLSEEDPQLEISLGEKKEDISISIMGDMQQEVIQKKIFERTGIEVVFAEGKVLYRETIRDKVEGAGHFEPLRHYAEVHVRLEPQARNSGIYVTSECSSDDLSLTWQKSILDTLTRKKHHGVLTGSLLTDVKIVLTAGRGSIKHTEGGDFRQAASRAVRQALMKAENVLLEPYYSFTLKCPSEMLSRALYDLDQKQCDVEIHEQENDMMEIHGEGPVRLLMNYQREVTAYTKGKGSFSCASAGYEECKNKDEMIPTFHYDPNSDLRNPCGSVFCAHGSGYYVPWDEADALMHIQKKEENAHSFKHQTMKVEDSIDSILLNAGGKNRNAHKEMRKAKEEEKKKKNKVSPNKPKCIIIDGYNMIYGWESLKEDAKEDFSSTREKFIDMMKSYHTYINQKMMLVFDAYQVEDNYGNTTNDGTFSLVYTKHGETADQWIEKAAYDLSDTYQLSVATSDGLIQNAVFSQGAERISARELENQYFAMLKTFEK